MLEDLSETAYIDLYAVTTAGTDLKHYNTRKLCYRKDDRAMRPIGPKWVP